MQTATSAAVLELPPAPISRDLPLSCYAGRGVFCTHCGSPIKLDRRPIDMAGHITMAWCQLCLHEAPYCAEDLTDL